MVAMAATGVTTTRAANNNNGKSDAWQTTMNSGRHGRHCGSSANMLLLLPRLSWEDRTI